jgi:hypothetical protein
MEMLNETAGGCIDGEKKGGDNFSEDERERRQDRLFQILIPLK